jgi:hypothetical protein
MGRWDRRGLGVVSYCISKTHNSIDGTGLEVRDKRCRTYLPFISDLIKEPNLQVKGGIA